MNEKESLIITFNELPQSGTVDGFSDGYYGYVKDKYSSKTKPISHSTIRDLIMLKVNVDFIYFPSQEMN